MTLAEPAVFGATPPAASTTDHPTVMLNTMHFGIPGSLAQRFSAWAHAVDIEIKEMLLLSEGWDGAAAYPMPPEAVSNARMLAAQIGSTLPTIRRPTVTPSIDGHVVLEWHSASRHIDFTVGPSSVEVFYEDEVEGVEWDGPFPDAPINPGVFLAARSW